MYLYLNTVLTEVFAIIFVFRKFMVFLFKYYAMYLDPRLMYLNSLKGWLYGSSKNTSDRNFRLAELFALDLETSKPSDTSIT